MVVRAVDEPKFLPFEASWLTFPKSLPHWKKRAPANQTTPGFDGDGTMTDGAVTLLPQLRQHPLSKSRPLTPTTDRVSRWRTLPACAPAASRAAKAQLYCGALMK